MHSIYGGLIDLRHRDGPTAVARLARAIHRLALRRPGRPGRPGLAPSIALTRSPAPSTAPSGAVKPLCPARPCNPSLRL
eukprot:5824118-Pyramimonas_sp.AAC.3